MILIIALPGILLTGIVLAGIWAIKRIDRTIYACKVCKIKAEEEFTSGFKYRNHDFLVEHSHDKDNQKVLEKNLKQLEGMMGGGSF